MKHHTLQILPLLAVILSTFISVSCTHNDEPETIDSSDVVVKFSRYRTPDEAVKIAENAWLRLLGDNNIQSRSSKGSIVDKNRPVEIISIPSSRGTNAEDTLLYIVNYIDNGGFAVVAAPKNVEYLLAVIERGNYDSNDINNVEREGFDMWLEDAKSYVQIKSSSEKIDTVIIDPSVLDTIHKTQVKEWNDTIVNSRVMPMLPGCWGQGDIRGKNLLSLAEGYYFSNGVCGCATLAIAEVALWKRFPDKVPNFGESIQTPISINWDMLYRHKVCRYQLESTTLGYWDDKDDFICREYDKHDIHLQIANLCRFIGMLCDAQCGSDGTSVDKDKALSVAKNLFGRDKVSDSWMKYNSDHLPGPNSIFVLRGENKALGGKHEWVSDGHVHLVYDHYMSTKADDYSVWETQYMGRHTTQLSHYNWGWYGEFNGWFTNVLIYGSQKVHFSDIEYYTVTK